MSGIINVVNHVKMFFVIYWNDMIKEFMDKLILIINSNFLSLIINFV